MVILVHTSAYHVMFMGVTIRPLFKLMSEVCYCIFFLTISCLLGGRTLDWLVSYREPIFPAVSEPYRCIPPPVPFNVTATGHLVTTGLKLRDSKLYCCYNKDINGTIFFVLSVTGHVPLTPNIVTVRFYSSQDERQWLYIEWSNVSTLLQPITRHTLQWNITVKDNGGVVDKRTSHLRNSSVDTPNTYYYLPYNEGEIYSFIVYASNQAGRGQASRPVAFDIDVQLGLLSGSASQGLQAWIIALIVFILVLLCCICCICCWICICCLCAKNKKKTYYAEDHGKYMDI